MTDSQKLLAEYSKSGSEAAFRELVTRYLDLVYSAAIRLMKGDTHRAEDVVQTVFADLARMAATLSSDVMLGGWLHRHTCHVAATLLRGERRRQSRERQAAEMNATPDHSEANLARVAPTLDEAINQLGAADRKAILLRFFERNDFRAIGRALGSNEDAAQKRVARALEKLRVLLSRRGVALTATALASVLVTGAVLAAPAGLIAGVTVTSLTTAKTPATLTILKLMTATKLKAAVIGAIVIVSVIVPLVMQQRAGAELREDDAALQRKGREIIAAQAENTRLSNLLVHAESPQTLPDGQFNELLKLRAQVGRLRTDARKLAEIATFRKETAELPLEQVWPARASHLKQWLDANPAEKVPELGVLPERLWLNSIYPLPVETDEECRRAMSIVRDNAESPTRTKLATALNRYAKDNNGQFPTGVSQLNTYLDAPLPDEILARYTILPAGSLPNELQPGGDWVITEKAPVNATDDSRHALGLNFDGRVANQSVTNRWEFVQQP